MHRLIGSAVCLCLLGLQTIASGTMGVPIESRIRRNVLDSSQIVVGRIVETEPFLLSDRTRVSHLVVDKSLFGTATAMDTLLVYWNANTSVDENGRIRHVAADAGEVQLDELQGARALWLLADKSGLRRTAGPFLLDVPNREQFERLANIVEHEHRAVDSSSIYGLRMAELESSRESVEKRAAFVSCLRDAIGNDLK